MLKFPSILQMTGHGKKVGVNGDFKKLVGKKKITIAIIDDAFQTENLSLKPYLKYNIKDFPDNNKDDDNNGKIDDYLGWDMSDNDPNVNPPAGGIGQIQSRHKSSWNCD